MSFLLVILLLLFCYHTWDCFVFGYDFSFNFFCVPSSLFFNNLYVFTNFSSYFLAIYSFQFAFRAISLLECPSLLPTVLFSTQLLPVTFLCLPTRTSCAPIFDYLQPASLTSFFPHNLLSSCNKPSSSKPPTKNPPSKLDSF